MSENTTPTAPAAVNATDVEASRLIAKMIAKRIVVQVAVAVVAGVAIELVSRKLNQDA